MKSQVGRVPVRGGDGGSGGAGPTPAAPAEAA